MPRRYFTYSAREQTRWGIPGRLWRVLRRRRVVELRPLVFLIALAAGSVIGLVLQLTLGVWWWLPAIALFVALLLLEATSAFWGGRRFGGRSSLRVDLLRSINPEKGAAAMRRENRERMLASGLPLIAPPAWNGRVAFGGWGTQNGTMTHLSINCFEIEHGEPHPPALTMTAIDKTAVDEDRLRRRLLRPLVDELAPEPTWSAVSVSIDGREYSAHHAESGDRACRYLAFGEHWLSIAGSPITVALPLSRIVDTDTIADW